MTRAARGGSWLGAPGVIGAHRRVTTPPPPAYTPAIRNTCTHRRARTHTCSHTRTPARAHTHVSEKRQRERSEEEPCPSDAVASRSGRATVGARRSRRENGRYRARARARTTRERRDTNATPTESAFRNALARPLADEDSRGQRLPPPGRARSTQLYSPSRAQSRATFPHFTPLRLPTRRRLLFLPSPLSLSPRSSPAASFLPAGGVLQRNVLIVNVEGN